MIRMVTSEEGGPRRVHLVVDRQNIDRLTAGQPIAVDVRGMVPDLVSGPLELHIQFEEDLGAIAAQLIERARADGGQTHVVPKATGSVS